MKQFGTSGECMDYTSEMAEADRLDFLRKYPTRWARFLHWLGLR